MTRMIKTTILAVIGLTATTFAAVAPQGTGTPPKPQTTPPPLPVPTTTPKPVLPFPADSKYAFVNMQQLLSDSKQGKAGFAEMQKLTDKWTADITEKNKRLTTLQNDLTAQASLLQPAALNAKRDEAERLQKDITRMQQDAQEDISNLNRRLLEKFQENAMPIINSFATEKSLYAIFVLDPENPTVAYVSPALDVTPEIIKRIDAKFPG